MTDDRFDYHRHLEDIALDDVAFLKKKDVSYGASWKRSGRSAWFMLKRMLDRLDAMMARPTPTHGFNMTNVDDTIDAIEKSVSKDVPFPGTREATVAMMRHLRDSYLSEDVLAKMEAEAAQSDPRSEMPDGTVYAVLRDLRRYCLLCDAEIRERTLARKFVAGEVIGSGGRGEGCSPVTLEDSNKHADRVTHDSKIGAPWCVDRQWRFDMGYGDSGRKAEFDTWWTQRTTDRWIPKEHVEVDYGRAPPAILAPLYICMTNDAVGQFSGYILDLAKCPTALRSNYSKLQQECNGKELEELPLWQRDLYWHDVDQGKYCLGERYVRWTSWQ